MKKSQHLKSFLSMLLDKCHFLKGSGWSREEEFPRREDSKWIQIILGNRSCRWGMTRCLKDMVCLIVQLTSDRWRTHSVRRKIVQQKRRLNISSLCSPIFCLRIDKLPNQLPCCHAPGPHRGATADIWKIDILSSFTISGKWDAVAVILRKGHGQGRWYLRTVHT